MARRVLPLIGQMYSYIKDWHDSASNEQGQKEVLTPNLKKGNVITSMVRTDVTMHKLVVDIDLPAKLIPSSTPGHYHLFIDKAIPKATYFKLLDVMAEAGLIEPGYADASKNRGYSATRLPWIRKTPAEIQANLDKAIAAGLPEVPFDPDDPFPF